MADTTLTYRLPNGTHVLIHHASDDIPLLLLDDGQVTDQPDGSTEIQINDSSEITFVKPPVVLDSMQTTEISEQTSDNTLENLEEFAEMVTCYKCRVCAFTATQKQDLLEHFRTCHVEAKTGGSTSSDISELSVREVAGTNDMPVSERLVFLCGQCSQGFASLEDCKEHMMQVHEMVFLDIQETEMESVQDEENADTAQPGPSESNRSEVHLSQKELWQAQKTAARFRCAVRGCQYKFSSEKDLDVHKSCHVEGKLREFICCKCQNPFERWRNCALHLWKVHDIDAGLLTCPVCLKYKSATAVGLDNHIRIHGDKRPFSCSDCGKCFKQAAQLRNHRVMHLDAADVPRWYTSKQCDICFKSYADSKCLKKHIQAVHSKLRPYVCQVCGHTSARKSMLQMHLRQHTGEKPHSCPICVYRTGDHNSLRRHLMRHTGQRPYHCPHCPYSAIQSSSYKNHLRSKHPGEGGYYSCSQCSYKTINQESFELHTSDHKNGFIPSSIKKDENEEEEEEEEEEEVFPGNVAAAQLIYRCLNALSADGNTLEANVTGSSTSPDGTTQTITIQIPSQDCANDAEDDETTQCFMEIQQPEEEEVDTGGITIPAEPEHAVT
ncbi:gastrula zinc finger protein XlCGF26.1 [Anabrus simplex]|uniref:gastrula zinc finger protein XlCGF26.1 n=1 Tax=Anabrus simplex TaxID=316456 RepID=UPI0035A30765